MYYRTSRNITSVIKLHAVITTIDNLRNMNSSILATLNGKVYRNSVEFDKRTIVSFIL